MKVGLSACGWRANIRYCFAVLLAISSQTRATVSTTSPTPTFEASIAAPVAAVELTGRLFLLINRVNSPEVWLLSTGFNSPEMITTDVHQFGPVGPQQLTADASAIRCAAWRTFRTETISSRLF